MVIRIAGSSKIGEILQSLIKKGNASIVCAACSRLLLENEKKVAIAETVYCEKDALAVAKATDQGLTDEAFAVMLVPCKTKGLKELGLYIYLPTPGSPHPESD